MARLAQRFSRFFPSASNGIAWLRHLVVRPRKILIGAVILLYLLLLSSYLAVFEIGKVRYNPKGSQPIYTRHAMSLEFGDLIYSDYEYTMPESNHIVDGMSLIQDWLDPWYVEAYPMLPILDFEGLFAFGRDRLISSSGVCRTVGLPVWPILLILLRPMLAWTRRWRQLRRQTHGFPVTISEVRVEDE